MRLPHVADLLAVPLTTERLTLAPLTVRDADDLHQAVEASRAHLAPWLPVDALLGSPDLCLRYAGEAPSWWLLGASLRFAVRDRATGRFLGVFSVEGLSPGTQSAGLGAWLRADAAGRGLAVEAMRALVRFCFDTLGLHRLATGTANPAALAMMERCGFQLEGVARDADRIDGRWLDHTLIARLSTDPEVL